MKQLTCVLTLLLLSLTIQSQNSSSTPSVISGKVLDQHRKPIELANVALLTQDSSFLQGTCSQQDGHFEINTITPDNHLLQISAIGYKTICRPCHKGNTGEWILTTDAVMLAETVITATRPVFKLKGGKLETNIQQTLLASLNSANDVLKHIPGVRSSDEGYTVFGKGTPIIYVDNRLLQDVSELERLAATNIDKIELITNPGAEYEATVKAVIRIRTIKNRVDGFGGNIRTGINQRRLTAHNEQMNVNYQNKGLSLLGMIYANYENTKRSQEVRYQIPSGVDWDINNQANLRNNGLLAGGKASVSYDFNPKHSLGTSYEFHRTPNFRSNDTSEYTIRENETPTDLTQYASENMQQGSKHQLNAYYQGTVKRLQINFTTDLVFGKSNNHQEAQEESQTEGKQGISSFTHASNRLYATKLMLTHSLWKGELKAGVDHTFIRRKDNFLNTQGILPNIDSRIDEKKSALFGEYSLTLGKVNILTGLRIEHVVTRYQEQGEFIDGQSRTYNDWCPNLSIDIPIGKTQTSLSYTAKSNRPNFFQLRSTMSYNNRFVYEGGNPLLTPEINHDLQLTTLYKWIQFSLNYQYRHNPIAFMSKEYEGNPDVVIFTTGNYKQMQYLTASAYFSPTINIWKPELGIYFTQPFFKVVNQGSTRHMNRSSFYLSWKNSINIPHEWIFSLDADYQSEGNFGAMLQHSYWGVDAGVRKSFFHKRLTLRLQANDLWNSRYSSLMLFGSRLTYTKRANPDSRSISLSISYRFNAIGKTYKGGHASEKDLQRL